MDMISNNKTQVFSLIPSFTIFLTAHFTSAVGCYCFRQTNATKRTYKIYFGLAEANSLL